MFVRIVRIICITSVLQVGCIEPRHSGENAKSVPAVNATKSEAAVNQHEPVSVGVVLKNTSNSKPPSYKHSIEVTISNMSESPLWVGIDSLEIMKIGKDPDLPVDENYENPIDVRRWRTTTEKDALITLFLYTNPILRCIQVAGGSQVRLTGIRIFNDGIALERMNIFVADKILVDEAPIEKWLDINMMSNTKEPISINHSSNESESVSHPGRVRVISLRGARLLTVDVEKSGDFVDYTKQ